MAFEVCKQLNLKTDHCNNNQPGLLIKQKLSACTYKILFVKLIKLKDDSKIEEQTPIVYNCSLCKQSFVTQAELNLHYESHCEKKIQIHLSDCLKSLKISDNASVHKEALNIKLSAENSVNDSLSKIKKNEVSCNKSYICKKCKKSFQSQANLSKHMKVHSNKIVYSCSICNKKFKKLNSIDSHLESHMIKEKITCEVCNNSFNNLDELKNHMKVFHFDTPVRRVFLFYRYL